MINGTRCIAPSFSALLALPLFLLAAASSAASNSSLRIRVERVLDGDTFHGSVLGGSVPAGVKRIRGLLVSVRLEGIDAPEKDQPWGDRSRAALAKRIDGDTVEVEVSGVDGFRRILGRVRQGSADVNGDMVATGNAWMFRRYTASTVLDSLERAARAGRRGLWSEPSPVEPWIWRKQHKRSSQRDARSARDSAF